MNVRLLRITICLLAVTTLYNTVSSQTLYTKGQKQFDLKAYDLSIENFKKELELNPNCNECKYMIAEAYRHQNNSIDAAIWYSQLETADNVPQEYFINYGNVLKKMGQYEKAQVNFAKYQQYDAALGEHLTLSCDYAKVLLAEDERFRISLYKPSSDEADYGVGFFGDEVIFASFRTDFLRDYDRNDGNKINKKGSQLFKAKKGREGKTSNVNYLLPDEKETYNIGAISYAKSKNKCAYTKNNYTHAGMEIFADDQDMHIYIANVAPDGSMIDEEAFEYNEIGYSTGFPTLNYEGKAMYFASNRPGGFGGYDIYVSYFKEGIWSYPENLGERINTEGNEITPFLEEAKLYFASDYHHGMGGFDIFSSEVFQGEWDYPSNLGNGINSPEDDFYPAFDQEANSLYFTSNRLGGRGQHDIYMGVKVVEHEVIVLAPPVTSEPALDPSIPQAINLDELLSDQAKDEVTANPVTLVSNPTTEDNTSILNQKSSDSETRSDIEVKSIEEVQNASTESSSVRSVNISEEMSVPPPAVSLEDINEANNSYGTSFSTVLESMAGIRKVAYGEVITNPNRVYFIQLAALYSSKGTILPFKGLVQYGNIYKTTSPDVTKIKLGYFHDAGQAAQILNQVKDLGFTDAFITQEAMNSAGLELMVSNGQSNVDYGSNYNTGYSTGNQYKVRLAAYEDPIWFDVNRVKDLGMIEQWSKRDWTIFVLSGYSSFEEANGAKIKALNRGFSDAEVVLDRNGILETINSH